jgi:hypothetical protein
VQVVTFKGTKKYKNLSFDEKDGIDFWGSFCYNI